MDKMTCLELKEFLSAQIEEIMKYKWCMGVKLCHDPLLDKSMEEIGFEWVNLFAKQYRIEWVEKRKKNT